MTIYDFETRRLDGEPTTLRPYAGRVLLIVNTASECGLTPQYEGLQRLYERFRDRGLTVLGFPCNQFGGQEPGDAEEIGKFCSLRYGVTFPLFEKTIVRGPDKHPLFAHLIERAPFTGVNEKDPGDEIKWNFTKFLVDRAGSVVGRFEPPVTPDELAPAVEALL